MVLPTDSPALNPSGVTVVAHAESSKLFVVQTLPSALFDGTKKRATAPVASSVLVVAWRPRPKETLARCSG